MWFYRRLLRIPWTKRVSNKEVLRIKETKRMLILRIKKRKLKFLGQRKQGLVLLVCFVLRHIKPQWVI